MPTGVSKGTLYITLHPKNALIAWLTDQLWPPAPLGGFVGPGPSGSPGGSGARCHCTHVGDGVSVELGDGFQPLQVRNQLVVALHVNNGLSRRGETEKG